MFDQGWSSSLMFGLLANAPFVAISFALVGRGNRAPWMLLGPACFLLVSAAFMLVYSLLPVEPPLVRNLYLYLGVTTVPASSLYAAVLFKRLRSRRPDAVAA